VEAGTHVIEPGGNFPVRVNLLNAENQPAKAPRPLSVILQARQPSGKVDELRSVEFATGQSSAQAAIQPPGNGLVYIWAKHSELLPGGAYVQIRAVHEALPSQGIPSARLSAPRAPRAAKSLPEVALRYSPDRAFLADGKDPVRVEAFLLGGEDSAHSDIRLNVFDGSGTLHPIPLTIPAGQLNGQSQLTSTNPGSVTIEYLSSTPLAEISGDKKLSIRFVAPVTHLDLKASPPGISLVDTSDLIVTLTDDQHRPVATDMQRQVVFAIESGQGSLRQQELVIPAGQFEVRTTFVPERSGEVRVSASSPNLLTVVAPLEVAAPVTLLVCSLAGGLIGGLLSRRKGHRRNPWRPIIGAVTGFLFYWACIFLRLGSIANGVALNPLSALALSMIGGWLQTKVFTAVWPLLQPSRATDSGPGRPG
jgi:hypothetical protein